MAKQRGIIQPRGKLGGYSFYRTKYVENTIIRALPANRSEQVKTADGYANTRAYAADFGRASDMAGALVRGMVTRWRYVLTPFRNSQLTRHILKMLFADTTHEVGRRWFTQENWREMLRQRFVALSKNDFGAVGHLVNDGVFSFDYDRGGIEVKGGFYLQIDSGGAYNVAAIDGVRVYNNFVLYKMANPNEESPLEQSVSIFIGLRTEDRESYFDVPKSDFGRLIGYENASSFVATISFDTSNSFLGQCVVFLPYKQVGDTKYILQKHCSFDFIPGVMS